MIIDKIEIKNFRSIKDETIVFKHRCMILLGKNEAGKSNILKAIAAVLGNYTLTNSDKRKRIDNERIDEYYIRAVLKTEPDDFNVVLKRISNEIKNLNLIQFENGKTWKEYLFENFNYFLIIKKVCNDSTEEYSYWRIDEEKWKLKTPIFYKNGDLNTEAGSDLKLSQRIFTILKEHYLTRPIVCNYWQYSKDFILPNSVNISSFIETPSNYRALENIFILCGRVNIEQEFASALSEDGDYSNLLDQVSKGTTSVFHEIWKDFKKTSLALIPNGREEMLVKIVNRTKYSFEDRSDGFKKFISILLMLSTLARSNRLHSRDLILIDEPDQSLYPTSARYLRDELIKKISETAFVVYTTHSQYMIDSSCINRHLVVEKENDISYIKEQNINAPFSQDELLRNAIGTSIFECLQDINLVFEGWLDKKLFDKYIELYNDKDFLNYGKVYLHGISGTYALIELLILANKKFMIISDSDRTSTEKRKEFEKDFPDFKNCWVAYGDLDKKYSTMEDFYEPSYITSLFKTEGLNDYEYSFDKSAMHNLQLAVPENKDKRQEIKNKLADNLKKTSIQDTYLEFISILKKKITKMKQ